MVSYETMYRWIWEDKRKKGTLYQYLRRKGKKYNKRGNSLAGRGYIPNRVDIEERPAIVDQKERFGDWEMDTIVDSFGHAILTLTERSTNFLLMAKLPEGRKALPTAKTVIRLLYPYKNSVKTITTDNGCEFAAQR